MYEPLGKAKIKREGTDASINTYGYGVQWAFELAEEYEKQGISLEILDLLVHLTMTSQRPGFSVESPNELVHKFTSGKTQSTTSRSLTSST